MPQQTRSVSSAAANVVPLAQEGLVHQLATLGVIQDRAPHQIYGLLGGVVVLFFIRSAHDELGGGGRPNGGDLTGLSIPGCDLLSHDPTRLMLEPIERSLEHRSGLVPNDVLVMLLSDA